MSEPNEIDLDGNPRIVDGDGDGFAIVDLGAYERQEQAGPAVRSYPYHEGFESDFGEWANVSGDDIDWLRYSDGTPSGETGPSEAHGGDYYLYVEASKPGSPNKVALLDGPTFDLSNLNNPELHFWYHMYGSNMGSLSVDLSEDGGQTHTEVWCCTGDQGDEWHEGTVDLSAYAGSLIQIGFVGVSGSDYRSDMAIDDISIVEIDRPQVVYPSEPGITWQIGSSYSIGWKGFSGPSVRIDLYKGDSLNRPIAASTDNDGEYLWSVPSVQEAGLDFKIKISSTLDPSEYDDSDNYFQIIE